MDEFFWGRWRNKRASSGVCGEKLAGKLPFEGTAGYLTMLDEWLRLHRAFCNVSNSALREAIVNLVAETERSESALA
jgi:hypothetical protein